MTEKAAAKRVESLRQQLDEYRYQYFALDKPTVADAVYDSLNVELRDLEAKFPQLVTPDSPTQRVGAKPLTKFAAVAHAIPMLSLNDVFDEGEVVAWVKRLQKLEPGLREEFFAEIKMDGLAASVVYQDGVYTRGVTRGDGRVGEDVTPNIQTINQVPLRLRRDPSVPAAVYQGRFEVRGEVLLYRSAFEQLNNGRARAGLALFANPRNTAAGTIRQLDPRLVAERRLSFHVYAVATEVSGINTHAAEHELAAKLGFKVEPHSQTLSGSAAIMKFTEQWKNKRQALPYGTDGLVFTVNDRSVYQRLGVVGKAPRGSIAYKFPAEQATTKLKNIMVSIGRTGAATPFAVLAPTVVAGSTIQMATLHNASEVARKDIRIGDTVIIQKAGDVIPEVVSSLPKLRTGKEKIFQMPANCPVCGRPLFKEPQEAVWRCVNFDCPALARGRIIHFASKSAFDIEGLGEKNVDALLDSKLISDAADLFTLKVEDLLPLERFAAISANNLIDAAATRRSIELDRFIYALGIRHVGAQTATDLAEYFGSLKSFTSSSQEDLQAVPGIGQVVAVSVFEWLSSPRHQNFLKKLSESGVKPQPIRKIEGPLNGQSIVITGTLEAFSREVAGEKIEALGGKFQNSVTKETNYLVIGDDPGASKVSRAQSLNVPTIDEKKLLSLIGGK